MVVENFCNTFLDDAIAVKIVKITDKMLTKMFRKNTTSIKHGLDTVSNMLLEQYIKDFNGKYDRNNPQLALKILVFQELQLANRCLTMLQSSRIATHLKKHG